MNERRHSQRTPEQSGGHGGTELARGRAQLPRCFLWSNMVEEGDEGLIVKVKAAGTSVRQHVDGTRDVVETRDMAEPTLLKTGKCKEGSIGRVRGYRPLVTPDDCGRVIAERMHSAMG